MQGQTLVREKIVYLMAKKEDCYSIDEAVAIVGISRQTLYTYMNVLGIQRSKFPFDRKSYVLKTDIERIKQLVEANR